MSSAYKVKYSRTHRVLRVKLINVLSRLKKDQPGELYTKPKAYPNNNTGNRQFVRKMISLENKNARKFKIESQPKNLDLK